MRMNDDLVQLSSYIRTRVIFKIVTIYHGVKLLSRTMNLWEKVIERKLREDIRILENPFNFMTRRLTMKAIHIIRRLIEFCNDWKKHLHMVFIDLKNLGKCYEGS